VGRPSVAVLPRIRYFSGVGTKVMGVLPHTDRPGRVALPDHDERAAPSWSPFDSTNPRGWVMSGALTVSVTPARRGVVIARDVEKTGVSFEGVDLANLGRFCSGAVCSYVPGGVLSLGIARKARTIAPSFYAIGSWLCNAFMFETMVAATWGQAMGRLGGGLGLNWCWILGMPITCTPTSFQKHYSVVTQMTEE